MTGPVLVSVAEAGGIGEAPIHDDKGSGTAIARTIRDGGQWSMRLLVVKVDGEDAPIVLVNADNVPIPDAALAI